MRRLHAILKRVFEWNQRAIRYAKALVWWFGTTQPLIVALAAVLVVFLFFAFGSCLEREIRLSGMALQLLGVMLVAVGLRDTRRAFDNEPTTWQAIKEWWLGRPKFGPQHHILAAAGGSLGMATASGRARVGPGPTTSLERRVEILEQGYASLFDEVGILSAEAQKKAAELTDLINIERSERQQADTRAGDQLRKAVAGGLPLGRVGAILFLAGTAAGTASPEIAALFGQGACLP
jgi:hypothetical protein